MSSLQINDPAPEFSFVDERGTIRRLTDFRGAPAIVAFAPASRPGAQPTLQLVPLDDEPLPVIAPADRLVANQYGAAERFAIFVVASTGTIVWRYVASEVELSPPSQETNGFTRREFMAAMFAASIAAGVAVGGPTSAAGIAPNL